jgi:hypothetical protein
MITNGELYTRVSNIMNAENFDKSLRPIAKFFSEHSEKYNVLPESDQVFATCGVELETITDLQQGHYEWFLDEFEKFTLYYEEGSNYELSSFRKQHLIDCNCSLEKIKSIDVDCLTINQLFEKYNIDTLDYLHVDTEGLDVHIISSIDFNKFKINNIIFEIIHADGTQQIGTNYTETIEYLKKLEK